MATTPTSASNQNLKISSITSSVSSSFLRTVCLHDWWLVKSENDFHGKILAVGGLASRLKQGVRVFSSAPIVKRHDTVTLETADGFTVMVKGLINSSRTRQNGFSHEVCNLFRIGFPYDWETYAASKCSGEECIGVGFSTSAAGFDELIDKAGKASPVCLDNFPVFMIRDLLMSKAGDSDNGCLTKTIFSDLFQKCSGNGLKNPTLSIHPNVKSNIPPINGVQLQEEAPTNFKQKCEKGKNILDSKPERTEESIKSSSADDQAKISLDDFHDPGNHLLGKNCVTSEKEISLGASKESILQVDAEVSMSMVGSKTKNDTLEVHEFSGTGYHSNKSKTKSGVCSKIERKYMTRSCTRLASQKTSVDGKKKRNYGSMGGNMKLCLASSSEDREIPAESPIEEKVVGGSSSDRIGADKISEQCFSKASNIRNPKSKRRLESQNDLGMHKDLEIKTAHPFNLGVDGQVAAPGKVAATRSSKRLRNLKKRYD